MFCVVVCEEALFGLNGPNFPALATETKALCYAGCAHRDSQQDATWRGHTPSVTGTHLSCWTMSYRSDLYSGCSSAMLHNVVQCLLFFSKSSTITTWHYSVWFCCRSVMLLYRSLKCFTTSVYNSADVSLPALANKKVILWVSHLSVIFSPAIKHVGSWQWLSVRDRMITCLLATITPLYNVTACGDYSKSWTHRKHAVCSAKMTSAANQHL